MSANILIVDDEADIRNLIKGLLEDEGYAIRTAESAKRAYEEIDSSMPDAIILDIWLQGSEQDGMQILANVKSRFPPVPIIMISGHGTIETAVSAIKQGAYDFIEKPFKSDRLLVMLRRALETARLQRENEILKRHAARPARLVGSSPAMLNLRQVIERVAPTNSRVLLTGEPGAGKDVAARVLHGLSARAARPLMVVNCATLRPERLEAELFVSEEPGAESVGVLEQADKSSLFLDEVSDMPLETQGKIVRVLQEQKFTRVGGKKPVEVDVRIIASTNRDLAKLIEEGKFRQDLFYRLNVVPLNVAPLRERAQDVPALVEHLAREMAEQAGVPARSYAPDAVAALQAYEWPGNVRQLRNVLEWVMIMKGSSAPGDFTAQDLPPEILGQSATESAAPRLNGDAMRLPLREAREAFERDYLAAQIGRFGGNISKTAQFIGMERSALHRKLKSLSLGGAEREEDGAVVEPLTRTGTH